MISYSVLLHLSFFFVTYISKLGHNRVSSLRTWTKSGTGPADFLPHFFFTRTVSGLLISSQVFFPLLLYRNLLPRTLQNKARLKSAVCGPQKCAKEKHQKTKRKKPFENGTKIGRLLGSRMLLMNKFILERIATSIAKKNTQNFHVLHSSVPNWALLAKHAPKLMLSCDSATRTCWILGK